MIESLVYDLQQYATLLKRFKRLDSYQNVKDYFRFTSILESCAML